MELGGKIMGEFGALRAKTHAYLICGYSIDDYDKEKTINKKANSIKKCVTKRRIMLQIVCLMKKSY